MVPHSFSLRQLQYAAAIADTGGFRRAAELCHVSQPSLSAQLAQLENSLGVRLFERDRRHVLITAAGTEVLARARRVLLEAEDLTTASTRLRDPLCGTLRIGVIPTVSPYLLPEITPAIRARYPRLTVHWAEEKTAVVLRLLREGGLDAALLALVPGMEGLERQVIADDRFVLAGAPSEPLLKIRRPARVEELEGASLLLLEDGHCFRDQALAFCEGATVFEEADYRATSLATLARMAAGGAGLTLLPELSLAVENRHRELAIRQFARPAPSRTLVLAWRAQSPLAASLRQIVTTLTAVPVLKKAPRERRSISGRAAPAPERGTR
jgi:LysR family hydrogen peroxide-inducible transcriptional activator